MDLLTKKELEGLKEDYKANDTNAEFKKNAFANSLINGLGEQIENDLKNKEINKVESGLKYRFKKWWSDRKEKRKIDKILKNGGLNGS